MEKTRERGTIKSTECVSRDPFGPSGYKQATPPAFRKHPSALPEREHAKGNILHHSQPTV